MSSRGSLSTANDLLDALVAESNYLGYGTAREASSGRLTDRAVAILPGLRVLLDGGLKLFGGIHKFQSSLLDKSSRKVDNTPMKTSTAQEPTMTPLTSTEIAFVEKTIAANHRNIEIWQGRFLASTSEVETMEAFAQIRAAKRAIRDLMELMAIGQVAA